MPAVLSFGLVLLSSLSTASAISHFSPICTVPTESTNLIGASSVRSTLGVLLSSLFAIFACAWVVLRLNIPEQRQGRHPGLLGDLRWKVKGISTKFIWMAISIMAPEWMLGDAALQLGAAAKSFKAMNEFAIEDGVPWTLTHAFFANMGGFVVKTIPGQDTRLEMASKAGRNGMQETIPLHLMAESLFQLRKTNAITLPNITADQINDKSKDDSFLKLITVLQVVVVIMQVAVRFNLGLAISQLEIATSAFAACAGITFLLLLYKPKDICIPLQLRTHKNPLPYKLVFSLITQDRSDALLSKIPCPDKSGINDRGISNTSSHAIIGHHVFCTYLGAAIFGGIHCLAWNFSFPTPIEQCLWRLASVMTAVIPLLILAIQLMIGPILGIKEKKAVRLANIIMVSIFGILYVAGRLFIMGEALRSLFYQPPGVFVATWTAEIPRFG